VNVAVAPGRLASRISPLLRETAFRRYWGAQSISLVGDQITSIALPLAAVLALHASPAEMGYLSALVWLPSLPFDLIVRPDARPRDVLDVAAACGHLEPGRSHRERRRTPAGRVRERRRVPGRRVQPHELRARTGREREGGRLVRTDRLGA